MKETKVSLAEDNSLLRKESATPAAAAVVTAARVAEPQALKVQPAAVTTDNDSSPAPSVRITLLQGLPAKSTAAANSPAPPTFYLIADGTGSIATYIHLASTLHSKLRIYGIDSPFLRCPSRLTPQIGIPGCARLIVNALLKKQPNKNTPFWLGGFSGGAMVAYEVSRQLSAAGHTVDGLLLIDMCAPRQVAAAAAAVPEEGDDGDVGLAMFDAVSGQDHDSGVWSMNSAADATRRDHLAAMFACVAAYHPEPLRGGDHPAKRAAIIWARRGMIDRCISNSSSSGRFKQMLADGGISAEAYPGFMEDPKLGAVAWSLPHKTGADLGPNGWERYLGGDERLMCMSIEADHLEMPTPGYAHLLGGAMDRAFRYFGDGLVD
jgi:zearalenone synthase (nonreducing iterative type I polyketide synthase)